MEDVAKAIAAARESDRPSLIACRTTIGFGAPTKAGTAATHGAPLGADEVAATREALGWPYEPYDIPDEIVTAWRQAGARGAADNAAWQDRLAALDEADRAEFTRRLSGALPEALDGAIDALKHKLAEEQPALATRKASQVVLEAINPVLPETIGGSADLTGSNLTKTSDMAILDAADYGGRYVHYGVREHGMAAAMNGLALHGGVIPYGGTFLVFTDYCRPAIRLSALMGQRVVYVMTHDSIGLGEDGPTHQPVEHLASLRAMPNLLVMRPADATETAECWQLALESTARPTVMALSRQGVPAVRTEHTADNLCARGAYELSAASGDAKVTLLATGTEVQVALEAQALLQADAIPARVVSVPCWELFDEQEAAYRAETLGPGTVKVAVEAAAMLGWERYTGSEGATVGLTTFGASAPAKHLYTHFNITPHAVAQAAKACLDKD
jgi:transketolase